MGSDPGRRHHLLDLVCASQGAAMVVLLLACGGAGAPAGPGRGWHALAHAGLVGLALAIPPLAARRPQSGAWRVVRAIYPVVAITYGFLALDALQPILFGDFVATDALLALDLRLFGVHPTVWVQRLYTPVLDECMAAFYSSYYVVPVVSLAVLLARGRERAALACAAMVSLTYFFNYALFYALPALGPRSAPGLAGLHLQHYGGWLFGSVTHAIQGEGGTVRGGVFPSAHVSATVAWAVALWRYDRRLARAAAVCAGGVACATVYLGYHHGVDPLAGVALGVAGAFCGRALLRRRGEE